MVRFLGTVGISSKLFQKQVRQSFLKFSFSLYNINVTHVNFNTFHVYFYMNFYIKSGFYIQYHTGRGFGLHVGLEAHSIKVGTCIGEYVGVVREEKKPNDSYTAEINSYCFVDGLKYGNLTRFMNHVQSNGNCKMEKVTLKGSTRLFIKTTRSVVHKEELVYTYNKSLVFTNPNSYVTNLKMEEF
jgi:hypothetical protein